jgi:hypothetical protein
MICDSESFPGVTITVTVTVARAAERQDQRKAELDVHRRDVRFAVGDEVLLDTEHTPLPSRSRLPPRWMGPFKVLAFPAPNTYCLDVPALAT